MELPSVADGAITCLFSKLNVQNIKWLIKASLLGKPIKIIGRKRNEIHLCCEALRSLVYPFNYATSDSRELQYITYNSLKGYSAAVNMPLAGIIGLDEQLIGRVTPVKKSLLVWIDRDSD